MPAPSATSGGLLRFITAGSVDDGKSTLIGPLVYDTQTAYDDQIDAVRKNPINRSSGPMDFSLLTDGLRAEREQGITIDVAYRYFSTPRRKFIIADTPGHVEYTRNMATGASTADAAVILIDASRGLLSQSRRHTYIAKLLGIRHLIFAISKMDLVAYQEAVFREVESQVQRLVTLLGFPHAYVVPVSALEGDNVVHPATRMPWFRGPAILEYLENVPIAEGLYIGPFRLPVQYVIRPHQNFRGFAGQIAAGRISKGDRVRALPSGHATTVRSIVSFNDERETAAAGDSVTLTLEDEIDLSRGDLLVTERLLPTVSRYIRATLVWMHTTPLDPARLYLIKHTTRTARARVTRIVHCLDVETLDARATDTVALNDIATVELEATASLAFDPYERNRVMGSFILIDPLSNATVAAGMIEGAVPGRDTIAIPTQNRVSQADRRQRFGHDAAGVWVEGPEELAATNRADPIRRRMARAVGDVG